MLFSKRFWPGIEGGTITSTFRRWKRRQVVAGNRYRTAAGIVEVETVDVVDASDVTDVDALRSGFADAAELLRELRGSPELPLYKVRFHLVDEPDPREQLAADDGLDDDAVVAITTRLERLDRASRHGPWTHGVLRCIADHPATRAPDLAETFGLETQAFKRDVRKLKALGLTISLPTGYRLSPRGEAYLAAVDLR